MITVVGSTNMDLIARVPHLPRAGETIMASDLVRLPGGKGANQAVAAARAGSRVKFLGRVGEDEYGAELLRNLGEAGVNTDHVVVDSSTSTGMALIAVDEEGENHIVVAPGANARVSPSDVEAAPDLFTAGCIVVTQLEIPLATVEKLARMAHDAGATVILNPAPARELDPSLLRSIDVIVPNAEEVGRLSGLGSLDPAAAAHMLLDTGVGAVVVTLGARGSVIVTRDSEIDVSAYAVRALDTTGAGDAFVGNLAHALDDGQSLEEAVRFASAASALSVEKQGAQPSMPWLNETNAFLRRGTRS